MKLTCEEVYAEPGQGHIIDGIDPVTGLTCVNGHNEAEILSRYPLAKRLPWGAWQQAAAARQQTPLVWLPCTETLYRDALEVLPPIEWRNGAFCVGEPSDHCYATGRPRYQAYRQTNDKYFHSSRPVTVQELRASFQSDATNDVGRPDPRD